MNFSINATHFQLGILPSSLQIEAIIEKKLSAPIILNLSTLCNIISVLHFFFKGASSSGVLTIQARTVDELIKYYQTI